MGEGPLEHAATRAQTIAGNGRLQEPNEEEVQEGSEQAKSRSSQIQEIIADAGQTPRPGNREEQHELPGQNADLAGEEPSRFLQEVVL